jgi:hypothetical protein
MTAASTLLSLGVGIKAPVNEKAEAICLIWEIPDKRSWEEVTKYEQPAQAE